MSELSKVLFNKYDKPTVKLINWYGFDHEAVNKKYTGGLTFCNSFCIGKDYNPAAVYKCSKPDLSKGHKKYVLLYGPPINMISGLTAKQMYKERFQDGIHCLLCNTVLFSVNRHHNNACSCPNEAFADGGKAYLRSGAKNLSLIKVVTIDLIKNKIVLPNDRIVIFDEV
jgi:hypothetical protein